MKQHVFCHVHPAVIFLYFCGAIGFAMSTMHPLYVVLSVCMAFLYGLYLKGWRNLCRSLRYSLVILMVVAAANAFFNGLGLTVLFMLGNHPITVEAICYGLCAGGMLVGVIQWFSCYQEVMTSDKFLSLFGRIIPTTSMMVTMIFRYIPDTIRKSREIQTAQRAMLGNEQPKKKQALIQGVRMASILMSWSMESSIETADSMRSRGYGEGRRSRYVKQKINRYDVILLGALGVLLILNGCLIFSQANQFTFYPWMEGSTVSWWMGAAYLLLLGLPLLLEGREQLCWLLSHF